MNSIIVVVIAGDKRLNDFMRAADVLEPFKKLAELKEYELKVNGERVPDNKMICRTMFDTAIAAGWVPVGAFIPNDPESAVFDESVKVITDGSKFALVADIRKAYGVSPVASSA